MKTKELSKHEALNLVTPVIDDEVCTQTRKLFMNYMKSYPEVQYSYKSAKSIKKLLKKRYPRAKASDNLHQRIKSAITPQQK